ncbi:deoxyribose-phosphate aldolase-like isoform X2 [Xenia sp. Carnegie-2017]|uniref:deoxyribose-phosphate aldolase-like isoform X2 n=1 Tax=Xenia sp. Carnegie-2017 TaxID=2897299 RepID=UPI001F03ADA5|nr:deoxyribose-phosphate aldolase-like isoform X2 [Xenia sp. Carnegie-2017]
MSCHVVRNPGTELNFSWLSKCCVNFSAVKRRAESLKTRRSIKKEWQAAWLLRAVSCVDLTTLSGDDTNSNVTRLCFKAQNPIRRDLLNSMAFENELKVGAVCVYPARVSDAVQTLQSLDSKIPVASVAAGFPAGLTPLKQRLEEIETAISYGAKEIDIVITRAYVLNGEWQALYDEVKAFRKVCGDAHLKTIIATGELGSLVNIYRASLVCMMAGSDFIKTSTGKESVNATFTVALVMETGYKVGFKPAGGIRSAKDSLTWLVLMKEELGDEWTQPNLFRIGASSLLVDIERQLFHHVTGRYAAAHELPMS